MKIVKSIGYIVISLVLVVIEGCNISSSSSRYDYTYLYDDDQKLIHPEFKIFHNSEDSTTLYYHLSSDNILYGKVIGDSLLKARILVKYKVFQSTNRRIILDSATIPLTSFGENNKNKILQGKLTMKVPKGNKYPLEVRFRDANKDINVMYPLEIDKRDNFNQQYFLLKDQSRVFVKPIISSETNIEIVKSKLIEENQFTIDYSNESYSMTPPPFASNTAGYVEIPIDSSVTVEFKNNKLSINTFNQINRLRSKNIEAADGIYFYHYYKGFPEITGIEQLTQPIRYISTSSEYKKVKNAINYKKAIDSFWLGLGKDEDRAKKMIKEYYNRVETSNRYFSSYKEGWKTDRGIIYIVYGIPTTIYKTLNREIWIYGEENNLLSVKFEFTRQSNPQSNNDYQLQRNSEYKNNWYRAVDMWRQAKIY